MVVPCKVVALVVIMLLLLGDADGGGGADAGRGGSGSARLAERVWQRRVAKPKAGRGGWKTKRCVI